MASINKLSIRGVRAFSPQDDEQVIDFFFPITVLVGQNGCGKTTIIESLKYAITGAMPPGVKNGQAFVHDPRSIGSNIVKASVKLKFTSRSGKAIVVVRSMELTQSKTKAVRFRTLDGVMRTLDSVTGEKKSISHKCTELDKHVPTLLGISGPILDYVLFCHQEDASWPLMEGAVLKKRFDDIFDSTRYTKALDVFRKTEKDLNSQVKDLKADIAGLASHKHAAEGFRKELREQEEIEEELGDDKKEILEKSNEIDQELERLAAIVEKVDVANNELQVAKNRLSRQKMTYNSKKEVLEKDYTDSHTREEIEEMLAEFDTNFSEQKDKEAALAAKVQEIQNDIDALHGKEMDLKSQIGVFHAKKEAHENRVKERFAMMEKLTQKYSVDLRFSLTQGTNASFLAAGMASSQSVFGGGGANGTSQDTMNSSEIAPEDLKSFLNSLKEKDQELKERLSLQRKSMHEEEDRLQSELMKLGGRQRSLDEERKKTRKRKDEIREKLENIPKSEISGRRIKPNDIKSAKDTAKNLLAKLEEARSNKRTEEIPTEIRSREIKIETVKSRIEEEKELLESLRGTADAQNEISVLEEQCKRDLEELQETLRSEASAFQRYGLPPTPPLPDDDQDSGEDLVQVFEKIVESVSEKHKIMEDKLNRESDEANTRQRALSEQKAVMTRGNNQLHSLKAKLERLSACVEKVRRVAVDLRSFAEKQGKFLDADEKSPENLLCFLDELIEDYESEKPGLIPGELVRKIAKRMTREMSLVNRESGDGNNLLGDDMKKVRCPCCKRDVKSTEVSDAGQWKEMVKKFVNELSNVSDDPNLGIQYERNHKMLGQWRKIVSDLQGDLRDYWRIFEDVTNLEIEMSQLKLEVDKCKDSLDDQNEVVKDLQRDFNGLQDLLNNSNRMSEEASRINQKKMLIKQKRVDLTFSNTSTFGRDLKTVEHDLSQLMEQKDALTNEINKLNKEQTALNSGIADLTRTASESDRRATEMEARYTAQQESEDLKRNLLEEDRELSKRYEELGKDLPPIQQKLRLKETERQRLRAHASEEEQKLNSTISSFGNDVTRFKELTEQINNWIQSDEPDRLEQIDMKLSDLAKRVVQRKKDLEVKKLDHDEMKDRLKNEERTKAQLALNLDLLRASDEISALEKEVTIKKEAIDSVPGGDTALERHEKLAAQKSKLLERKAQIDGRRSEVVERIRSIKRKLTAPEYKDVDKQYKIAMIKSETTQIAAEDLKKYQKALDQALLQYHSVKIAEVNKLIRELWLLTYKGEDISNIEIVSGQEAGTRAQKSYNYRVVMTKGNAEMDMRGRCSAGQRVLASIVIRLALAETFGVNCGCIALDEPTVNLDYKNKKGLAIALAQIVAARAKQRNFQLILITHDEDFVGMMKTELSSLTGFSMPEKYFEVCREQSADGKYYSKIHAKDWDELL